MQISRYPILFFEMHLHALNCMGKTSLRHSPSSCNSFRNALRGWTPSLIRNGFEFNDLIFLSSIPTYDCYRIYVQRITGSFPEGLYFFHCNLSLHGSYFVWKSWQTMDLYSSPDKLTVCSIISNTAWKLLQASWKKHLKFLEI